VYSGNIYCGVPADLSVCDRGRIYAVVDVTARLPEIVKLPKGCALEADGTRESVNHKCK
jgi:hypothetical protein